jgi:hypothetical protein
VRGLTDDERATLADMLARPEAWLDEDDEHGEEVRNRLVTQGRARFEVLPHPPPGYDPDEWETLSWEVTDLGRLALRVCTKA